MLIQLISSSHLAWMRQQSFPSGSLPAEKDHDFTVISVQLEPFETCIALKFVQLELQSFSRVWSESNVISIITVRDLKWIQGSGSTSLYRIWCHCYKGSTEEDLEGRPASSLCWMTNNPSTSLSSESDVIVIKGVQKRTQRAGLLQAFVGCNLLRKCVASNN